MNVCWGGGGGNIWIVKTIEILVRKDMGFFWFFFGKLKVCGVEEGEGGSAMV